MLSTKSVDELSKKVLRKRFQFRKTQFDVATTFWNPSCSKNVIPNAQSESKVYTIRLVLWQLMRMMPYVHLRIIKNILQWSDRNREVPVIPMSDECVEHVDDEEIFNAESDHRKWDVGQGFVDNVLHPMIAEMRCESHLLNRMMNFMKLP